MRTGVIIYNNDKLKLFVIILLLIIVTQGFSYFEWGKITSGFGMNFIISGVLFIAAVIRPKRQTENFSTLVYLLIIWPFFSIPCSLGIYGQTIASSIHALTPNLVWSFYFVLHRFKFKETTILKALIIYSLVMLAIMVIQQITYPTAYFGILNDDAMLEKGLSENVYKREGFYRFLVHQNGYTAVPVLLFYLSLVKKKFTLDRLAIILFMLIAVYLSLTRQVVVSCIFVVLLSFLINKKQTAKIKYLILLLLFVSFVYANFDVLWGEMFQTTKENLDKDYIRFLSYSFYWDKICENIWSFFLGHGVAKSGEFLHQFTHWQYDLGLYSCDVGIIGIWFHYGLVYVILYFYSLILMLKNRKKIPTYVMLFTIFAGLMSIMIFPFWINQYFGN